MHKLIIQISEKTGYLFDLLNDKNGKILHSWKNQKMLEKWIEGYVPGNGKNFVKHVVNNGSAKIMVAPNKFVIPFRESKYGDGEYDGNKNNHHVKTKKDLNAAFSDVMRDIHKGNIPKGDIINGMTGEIISEKSQDGREYAFLPKQLKIAMRELK